jgi:hypothetical protein
MAHYSAVFLSKQVVFFSGRVEIHRQDWYNKKLMKIIVPGKRKETHYGLIRICPLVEILRQHACFH